MRVMLIDPSLYAPQYNDPLASALADDHDLVVIGRPERHDQVPSAYAVDGHFYRVSERLRSRSVKLGQVVKPFEHAIDLVRLIRRVRRQRVDVAHFQWAVVPLLDQMAMRLLAGRCAVVFTVHDTKTMHGSANTVQRLGMAKVLRNAHLLVVHTQHSRQVLIDAGFDPARIEVIPHGPVGRQGRPRVRAGDRLQVLEYGKIRPYKGVDVLLEALALARDQIGDRIEVTIAGEPLIDMAPLQAMATDLGVGHLVRWELGYISGERTEELLATHDVMALPYRDIDSSGVLALAQTWPMPVLATRVGGFAEQLAQSEGARLVPVDDAAALAAELVALTEPAALDALAAGAAADVQRLPGWELAAELHTAAYRHADAIRRGGPVSSR